MNSIIKGGIYLILFFILHTAILVMLCWTLVFIPMVNFYFEMAVIFITAFLLLNGNIRIINFHITSRGGMPKEKKKLLEDYTQRTLSVDIKLPLGSKKWRVKRT